jgi:hypothetical protein
VALDFIFKAAPKTIFTKKVKKFTENIFGMKIFIFEILQKHFLDNFDD